MLKDCPCCWHEVGDNSSLCASCGFQFQPEPVFNDIEWEEFPEV